MAQDERIEISDFSIGLLRENAFITLIGHRGSGKTYLALWLYGELKHKFDDVYVLTKTGASGVWDPIVTDKNHLFRKDFPEALRILIECQELVRETHGKERMPRLCIILDDILHHLPRDDSSLGDLATTGRWLNCTVILLSQYYKSFVPDVRDNTDLLVLFSNISRYTAECVFDETSYSAAIDRDQFREIYRTVANGYTALAILKTSKAQTAAGRFFAIEAPPPPPTPPPRDDSPDEEDADDDGEDKCIIL